MHANIHLDRKNPTKNRLVIDGQDLTKAVLLDGFSIGFESITENLAGQIVAARPVIYMTLRPDTIDLTGDLDVTVQIARAEASSEGAE